MFCKTNIKLKVLKLNKTKGHILVHYVRPTGSIIIASTMRSATGRAKGHCPPNLKTLFYHASCPPKFLE